MKILARGQIQFIEAERGESAEALSFSPTILSMQDEAPSSGSWWQQYKVLMRVKKGEDNVSNYSTVSTPLVIKDTNDTTTNKIAVSCTKRNVSGDIYFEFVFTKYDDDAPNIGYFDVVVSVDTTSAIEDIEHYQSVEDYRYWFNVTRISQRLSDYEYLLESLPDDGLSTDISDGIVLANIIGVKDNSTPAKVVAAMNGLSTTPGFQNAQHGTVMIASGITNLGNSNTELTAATKIYSDGTISTNKLVANNANISGDITATRLIIGNGATVTGLNYSSIEDAPDIEEGGGIVVGNKLVLAPYVIDAETTAEMGLVKEDLARKLGYASYDALISAASSGATIINGGYIRTSLIDADAIVTGYLSANKITANDIDASNLTVNNVLVNATNNGSITVSNGTDNIFVANKNGVTVTGNITATSLTIVEGATIVGTIDASNISGTLDPSLIDLSGFISSDLIDVANGVAGLDNAGKIPVALLPSYVDDVLEYANLASFPSTGESGKIYVDISTNKTYRWSGSAYVEISASLVIGTTGSTAAAGNHTHGNITNDGKLYGSGVNIENGDKLVIIDSSNDNKIGKTTIEFDGSTTTKALTQKGTFETFLTSHQSLAGYVTGSGTSGYLTKWNGSGSITNGPAFGSGTTKYLREDGTWAIPAGTSSWRPIYCGNESIGNNNLVLKAGSNIQLSNNNGEITISSTDDLSTCMLTADYVTAGLIDADKINVSDLIVNNNLLAKDGEFSGTITVGSGNAITKIGESAYPIWSGGSTANNANFKLSNTGVLNATGATITGTINASSGSITGQLNLGADGCITTNHQSYSSYYSSTFNVHHIEFGYTDPAHGAVSSYSQLNPGNLKVSCLNTYTSNYKDDEVNITYDTISRRIKESPTMVEYTEYPLWGLEEYCVRVVSSLPSSPSSNTLYFVTS